MSEDKLVDKLVEVSYQERTAGYKAVAMLIGVVTFLLVVPGVFFLAGYALEKHFLAGWEETIRTYAAWAVMMLGLLVLAWSAITLVISGRGTPAPLAPPQRLIVSGPYRFSRNPMQLGAMLYYFGIGTLLGSVLIGALMLALCLILGTLYHKLVEERELTMRFGKEYEDYRDRTPFLIPRLR